MNSRFQSRFGSIFLPLITVAILLTGFLIYLPSQASPDTTLAVNSTDDTDDGTCDAANCTLREAINAANDVAGADIISFNLLPSSTITLARSQLHIISGSLTIDGSTAVNLTVRGDYSRTFKIDNGTVVTITTLTITRGSAPSGGGIFNSGTLIIIGTGLSYNSADLYGAGIYNSGGTLKIVNSTINGNYADENGGAIFNAAAGTVDIVGSMINGNTAYEIGGAIYNAGGTVDIVSSNLSNNFGREGGGGIYNAGGMITIKISTITQNSTFFGNGGGIINSGVITINNSTFSGNYCKYYHATCYGGGIYGGGSLNINNSTFSGNSAGGYPGPPPYGGGIYGGSVNFSNSIIANSSGGDCVSTPVTNINNLVEDGSCTPAFSGDPLLGPLQDNGGPTWTHAPFSFSPVVDTGDDGVCAAPPVNNLDQRGVARPTDGDGDGTPRCDIGAYEYDGPPPFRILYPAFFNP